MVLIELGAGATLPKSTESNKNKGKTMKKNKIDWLEVMGALPHGSGIDSDWGMSEERGGMASFANSYHGMDEYGGYDGWLDFRIVFFRHKADVLNHLSGPCAGKVQVVHRKGDIDFRIVGRFSSVASRDWGYGLKSYLAETVRECLEDAGFGDLCGKPGGILGK
jgi:hypothetical protein